MGDVVIEFKREGEVVWQWRALDHLDPYRIGYETFTPYWILGDHAGWKQSLQPKLLTPIGERNWFYHQHMPQITPEGTLVLF